MAQINTRSKDQATKNTAGGGPLEQAKDYLKSTLGRELNSQDISFLEGNAGWNSKDYGTGYMGAAKQQAAVYKDLEGRVQALANSADIQLGEGEAAKIRDSLYQSGNTFGYDHFTDLVSQKLASRKIEQLQNPTVAPDKQVANQQRAAELLTGVFGDANDREMLEYITDALNKGESAFNIKSALKQTDEYQEIKTKKENDRVKAESKEALDAMNQRLQADDETVFNRALPTIMSSYQKAGRIGSSGVANALARERARIAQERQSYVAGLDYDNTVRAQGYGREDFVNRGAQAFSQYIRQNEPTYQRNVGLAQASYQTPLSLFDQTRQRANSIDDYSRQQSDYNRSFERMMGQQRQSDLYGLAGNILGAGAQGLAMRYAYRR